MQIIILAILGVSFFVLAFYALFSVWHSRGKRLRPGNQPNLPFVSLLKPIKMIDDDMERNLESFFTLDYPRYEVLFAVDRISDPCVALIERVRRKHPEVDSAVFETGTGGRQNPKIHKLALLEARSRGDLLWVTDSNIRVERDTLARLADEYLRSGAKAIFSPVRGTSSRTFASLIENTSLNFFTSGSIITAWKLLRQHIVVGKSVLIEKKAMGTLGGFGYFKNYLAEDFLLGETFVKSGFRVSTNYTWVTNINQRSTVGSYFRRMARWAKLRYRLRPPVYAAEVLLNPIALALAALPFMGRMGLPLLSGVILLKVALEYVNFLVVNKEDRRRPVWHLAFPAAVIAKDLLALGFYIVPFLSRRVVWRGVNMSIGKKTLIYSPAPADNLAYEAHDRAWVVSVHMGLGHLRAAYPLRRLAPEGIIIYGSKRSTPAREYKLWRRMRRLYYASSQVGRIPLIGRFLLAIMLASQRIRPYYPKSDQSKPSWAVRYLNHLIRRRGLCAGLRERMSAADQPIVHTFYATALALDAAGDASRENYLLICDADFNRVWVPKDPRTSRIKYLAPCTQVKRRLLAYGVREESIFLTGFPLPPENIGTEAGLEILKEDLFSRLLRLDPTRKFFSYHMKSVLGWLGYDGIPAGEDSPLQVMFAIGGAGAQSEMVKKIMKSLAPDLRSGEVRLVLSCGIQEKVFERVLRFINDLGLSALIDNGITIIFDRDIYGYLDRFNLHLRRTDVLWTKPSELAFYCGLGIPILAAPPIGTHEELNRRWLEEIHAVVTPPGPVDDCSEWLGDLRKDGRLAEAAWDGFLKARKLGAYKIAELVLNGTFQEGHTPLEQ